MKRILVFIVILSCFFTTPVLAADKKQSANREKYGVFIGLTKLDYKRMGQYDVVVIDAEYFTKKQINRLKAAGCKKVYTYLNIGSLEDFRDYYKKFEYNVLSEYENWTGEYWMDLSNKEWQNFCISRAKKLKKKGVDGFFIDNCDVYYHYRNSKTFNGLVNTLSKIKKIGGKIIINGGDYFVSKCISKGKTSIIDAVNQESVYTSIDFDAGKFKKAAKSERTYFTKYLKKVKKTGIGVYVLEYSNNATLTELAKKYDKKHGFKVYVSNSIELR